MKALVYKGPGEKGWVDVPDPKIEQPTDVVVKMVATTICGTDLHLGNVALEDVEIRPADRGGDHLDDHVGRLLDLRVRYVDPALLPRALVDQCLHGEPPVRR